MSQFIITKLSVGERYKFLPWLICGIGAIFYFYEYFLRIAPSVMSSDLMGSYHLTAGQYGGMTAFYYYAYTPMQLIVGVLMDRYGPRRLLMGACLACSLGAFIFAGSHHLMLAELSRLLIGFGSAFAFVGALKLATIWLPPERFAEVSGMITSLGMFGAIVGDIFLTKMIGYQGWRASTFVSGWIGVILVIMILLIVHDKVKTSRKEIYTPELSFRRVFIGLRHSLKNTYVWINGLIGCLLFLPVSAFAELWGIPYLTQAHHLTHSQAATTMSMVFFGWAIGAPLSGWISDFIRQRRLPIMIGSILSAITIVIILYMPNLSLFSLRALLLIFGVITSVQVIVFAVGREVSPKHIAGTSVALTNTFVMMGGVLFQPIIGVLLDWHWNGQMLNGVGVYSIQNYQFALSILPIGLLISFILSFFLRETHCCLDSQK